MSLDFSLTRMMPTELFHANITHNMTSLWEALGIYEQLYKSHGKYANDIYEKVRRALDALTIDPEFYKQYDSPNGWGTYDNAVSFLSKVVRACEENPGSLINVDA